MNIKPKLILAFVCVASSLAGFLAYGNNPLISLLAGNNLACDQVGICHYNAPQMQANCAFPSSNNCTSLCTSTFLQASGQGILNCDSIFTNDTIQLQFTGNPTNYCVPVPLTELAGFELYLNGNQFSNPFACDFEPTTAYSYTFLPGAGFNGPYQLSSWMVGTFSYTGFFNNANDLLGLMQVFDPTGNWQINLTTGLIYGGNPNTNYGNMQVQHIPSGTNTVLTANTAFLPTGFTVGLPTPGLHALVVVDTINGCSDTLYINAWLNPVVTDTIYLTTTVNTPTPQTCLDGSELPGGVIVNVGYCGAPSNGSAPLASASCVYYIPNLNFAGTDEFCMVFCDGEFPQTCDTTYFIVNVLPQIDTVFLTIPNGENSVDTCLSSFIIELPGPVTSASFCSINLSEITGTVNGNCLIFNANGNFYGTTTVCVEFCKIGRAHV